MYILFKLCTAFFTAQSTSRKGKSTKFFLFRRIYHSTGTGLFPVPGCFWFPFLTLCPLPPITRRTAERGREAKKDVLSCLTGRPSGGDGGSRTHAPLSRPKAFRVLRPECRLCSPRVKTGRFVRSILTTPREFSGHFPIKPRGYK